MNKAVWLVCCPYLIQNGILCQHIITHLMSWSVPVFALGCFFWGGGVPPLQ